MGGGGGGRRVSGEAGGGLVLFQKQTSRFLNIFLSSIISLFFLWVSGRRPDIDLDLG